MTIVNHGAIEAELQHVKVEDLRAVQAAAEVLIHNFVAAAGEWPEKAIEIADLVGDAFFPRVACREHRRANDELQSS